MWTVIASFPASFPQKCSAALRHYNLYPAKPCTIGKWMYNTLVPPPILYLYFSNVWYRLCEWKPQHNQMVAAFSSNKPHAFTGCSLHSLRACSDEKEAMKLIAIGAFNSYRQTWPSNNEAAIMAWEHWKQPWAADCVYSTYFKMPEHTTNATSLVLRQIGHEAY